MIDTRYAFYASLFLDEIRNSITTTEKAHLKELLYSMKESGELDKWIEEYFPDEVLKFARQTPQGRKKNKKWSGNRNQFLLLSYYAYRILEASQYLIDEVSGAPGHGPYREVCTSYGMLCLNISDRNFLGKDLLD